MVPRIAIPIPTSLDPEYNRRNWPAYADAVRQSGGEPVPVDLGTTPREIIESAGACRAILLPGSGADVNAAKYGCTRLKSMAAADEARENVDELLLQDAHNLYKPILGICFGAQMLNVWRSGTLIRDLSPVPVNHRAGASVATAHTVLVAEGSLLAGLLRDESGPVGRERRVNVNSTHHQAIDQPGDGLEIVARCTEDGVAESIENRRRVDEVTPIHFVLGVQWHPERAFSGDSASRAIVGGFVEAARAWRPREVRTSVARFKE